MNKILILTFELSGNINDILITDLRSESEEDEATPDVLGSILKQGNSTGVLSGGLNSNFQEIVIKVCMEFLSSQGII